MRDAQSETFFSGSNLFFTEHHLSQTTPRSLSNFISRLRRYIILATDGGP